MYGTGKEGCDARILIHGSTGDYVLESLVDRRILFPRSEKLMAVFVSHCNWGQLLYREERRGAEHCAKFEFELSYYTIKRRIWVCSKREIFVA